ncbi:SBBP repeat-containing protein, partial [Chloroflexota bacterium]
MYIHRDSLGYRVINIILALTLVLGGVLVCFAFPQPVSATVTLTRNTPSLPLAVPRLAFAADPNVNMPIVRRAPDNAFSTADTNDGLLQFTSAGHVLGFSEDGVIVASARHMLRTDFLNAREVSPEADSEVSGERSADAISPLGRVTYRNLWDGVTVVYEANGASIMKSTYYIDATKEVVVQVNRIRLGYNCPVQIDENGNLHMIYEDGTMVEDAPVAWQETESGRKPVAVTYELCGEREVGFSLDDYTPGIPVVIDPVMTWNTFLGSSGDDYMSGIAVDSSGNVYVSGYSDTTWGSPVRAYTSDFDAFVAKLDSSGALAWNTFLGGSGVDVGLAIAVDSSGNVYVGGYSITTWGSPVRAYTSDFDAFAAKLDSSGALTWHTFLGGSSLDLGYAIAVDSSGNVYVGGQSYATWGSPERGYIYRDAFVAKLDSSGALTWNTFLGGSGADAGKAVAVDSSGNVYVGGYSYTTWGSPVRAASDHDAFVAKLDSSGALTWNTFLGGSGADVGKAIAVDSSGNVYIGGETTATWGSPVRAYTSGDDAFVTKLDSGGALAWNTIERYFNETITLQSTTSTTYVNAISLSFTPPTTKDYLVVISALTNNSATDYSTVVQLNINGTGYSETFHKPVDTALNWRSFGGQKVITANANVAQNISIQYKTENAASTAYIQRAVISVIEIANYYNAEENAETSTTSTTYVPKATLTFTPPEAADYLVLATSNSKNNTNWKACYVQMTIDGIPEVELTTVNSPYASWAHAEVMNFSAAQHTIQIRFKTDVSGTAFLKNARITVVRLSDFGTAYSSNSLTESNTQSTTYQDNATLNFTSSQRKDYFVIASGLGRQENTAKAFYSNVDIDGTSYGEYVFVPGSTTLYRSFQMLNNINLSAATHNIKVQYKTNNADITTEAFIKNVHVVAIESDTAESYSDSTHATVSNNFPGPAGTSSYIWAHGLRSNHAYAVAYYDSNATGGGDLIYSESVTSTVYGNLSSQYTLSANASATAGAWHAVVFDTEFGSPPSNYNSTGTSPAYVVEDSFNVEVGAIIDAISQIVFTTSAQTIISDQVSTVMTIQSQDAGGSPVNVTGDTTIDLSSTSGAGRFDTSAAGDFNGSITSVTITNGSNSADFYYKDTAAGTPTITAENPSQTWTDATQQQTINPGTLDHFTFNAIIHQISGTAFSITITAKDASENTVTSYSGTPTLSDTTGTISPTVTGVFSSGNWTGNVTISTANAGVTITATEGAITGTSNSFAVHPSALHHFTFNSITTQISGTAFSITITAKDVNENTVTSYNDTLTLSDTTGTISPTMTGAFSSGTWTGNVTITTANTGVTITATDGAVTGTSNSFDFNPNEIYRIIFTTSAQTITVSQVSTVMT